MLKAFGLLARLKGLRGTPLDIFGYTAERREERALITQYRDTVQRILPKLDAGRLQRAVELASLPEDIRGYGHVKEAAMARVAERRERLMAAFEGPSGEQGTARAA